MTSCFRRSRRRVQSFSRLYYLTSIEDKNSGSPSLFPENTSNRFYYNRTPQSAGKLESENRFAQGGFFLI